MEITEKKEPIKMIPESVWNQIKLPTFPTLKQDIHTDVLIIGGGMAGILMAYFLQKNHVDYVLVEKGKIGSGTTQNTTAKITAQPGLIYQKIMKSLGIEKTQKYLDINLQACKEFEELCTKIDCNYEKQDNYVYSVNQKEMLMREMDALEKIHADADYCDSIDIPMETVGAVRFHEQAQFHPLKFIAGIVDGLHIFENTFVREMIDKTAVTDYGKIYAKRVVVATHFPFINKHGSYFLKLYQHRSYVIALEDAGKVNGMYVDENHRGFSFRNEKNLLLLGGGGHRTGKDGGGWKALRIFAREHYPDAEERYHWAAQDCMSLDSIPYIGPYSKSTQGLYVATGFNKWGMAQSMVSAKLLTDMLMERQNDYADIFSPSRSIIKPQLFINGFEATKNLLTITPRRCPHLGCALKWNSQERTWDCACHGSRFSEDGKVLDNPANGDL